METWIYLDKQNQNKLVIEEELPALVDSGEVEQGTLVWREGMSEWQTAAAVLPQLFPTVKTGTLTPVPPGLHVGATSGQKSREVKMCVLKDMMTFAWRGSGKYVLISCVVLSVVADLAAFAPVFGAIASLLLSGYFCAIYYQLIQSTATGGKEAPEFPDTSNILEDIIWPMLQMLVVGIVSFGPYLGYEIWAGEESGNSMISYALLGLGAVYFPMAILAVVILGYTGALSPHIVFPALVRGGWIYWVGFILLLALYFLNAVVEDAFSKQIIIGHLIMAVVGSYTLMTNARILGVVYRDRQEELGWL